MGRNVPHSVSHERLAEESLTEIIAVLVIPLTIALMAVTFVITVGAAGAPPPAVDSPKPASISNVEGVEA